MCSRILFCMMLSFQLIAAPTTLNTMSGQTEDLLELKSLNEKKIDLLLTLEKSKQAELNLIQYSKKKPRANKSTYPLRLSSDDGKNYLDFHARVEADQDIFYNIEGLDIYSGLSVKPMYRQNTVDRFWANHISPILLAHLDDHIIAYYVPDFGLQQFRVFDAYVETHYTRQLNFQMGKQKDIVGGLENLLRYDYNHLMYPSFPYMLAPNREIGFYVYGALGANRYAVAKEMNDYGFNDAISYQLGMAEGAADNDSPGLIPTVRFGSFNITRRPKESLNNKSIEARLFFNPFINNNIFLKNLGLGISGSLVNVNNQFDMPAILSLGVNPIFSYNFFTVANGPRVRIHPQMLWYNDSFGLYAEWVQSSQYLTIGPVVQNQLYNKIYQRNQASQIQVAYNLTHEKFNFDGVKPNNNFRPFESGAYGAWQVICRLSKLIIDPSSFSPILFDGIALQMSSPMTSVQQALGLTIGLNWRWNDYMSVMMEYDHTQYVGGCSTGALDPKTNAYPGCITGNPGGSIINRPSEKVFMQRLKFVF